MRPYISGRARAPLALGFALIAAASAISDPAATAAGDPGPVVPEPVPSLGTGGSGGVALVDSLPVPRVRLRLTFRRATLDVLEGTPAKVAGTLVPGRSGRMVTLQMLGRHGWRTLAHAVTGRRGRFALRYTPPRVLTGRVRVRFGGDAHDLPVRRFVGHLRAYRLAAASWYGGGGGLACGGELTSYTMGVANKTLPCGTMITLRYGGRTVRVPVIDRGPYVAGREFDLTEATKRALGFEGVGEVWSSP